MSKLEWVSIGLCAYPAHRQDEVVASLVTAIACRRVVQVRLGSRGNPEFFVRVPMPKKLAAAVGVS